MVKLFYVTSERKLNKRTSESRVVGFVSVFGWESAKKKAEAKYPGFAISGLHERPLHRRK